MNAAELYFLGWKLTAIASEALPADSVLRRLSPAARLVLEDATRHPGAAAAEIAARTGMLAEQVSELAREMAAEHLATVSATGGIHLSRSVTFRGDAAVPVDTALATALGTASPGELLDATGLLESLARRLDVSMAQRAPGDYDSSFFDAAYQGTPPWDTGHPQPALAELAEAGAFRGRVLDVGCGTGEHALLAASLGLPATGVDASATAIGIARRKAAERGLAARFAVHDALDLGSLGEQFDTVVDSALFHVFEDDDLPRYEAGLRQVLPVGGRYFLLCFSDRQPPGFGPRRVTQDEIKAVFGAGWRVDVIEPATLEVTVFPDGVQAWRASLTRV